MKASLVAAIALGLLTGFFRMPVGSPIVAAFALAGVETWRLWQSVKNINAYRTDPAGEVHRGRYVAKRAVMFLSVAAILTVGTYWLVRWFHR